MAPPRVRFLTRIYHPNIGTWYKVSWADKLGRICLDILKGMPYHSDIQTSGPLLFKSAPCCYRFRPFYRPRILMIRLPTMWRSITRPMKKRRWKPLTPGRLKPVGSGPRNMPCSRKKNDRLCVTILYKATLSVLYELSHKLPSLVLIANVRMKETKLQLWLINAPAIETKGKEGHHARFVWWACQIGSSHCHGNGRVRSASSCRGMRGRVVGSSSLA